MRVLIVGLGKAGRRHARHALALGHDVAALRRAASDPAAGIVTVETERAAEEWRPDAVIVATPTSEHAAGLSWALERSLPTLVEKPLADSPAAAAAALVPADGVPVAVGYNLRFHPALEAIADEVASGRLGRLLYARAEVGQFLPDWHAEEDYRRGYAARGELGGGALLTLSHELDYVRWIAGEIERCEGSTARVSALEIDVDDVAELVCRHRGGALSSVHMDFLDRAYNRRCRFVCEDASLEWRWGGAVTRESAAGRETIWDDPDFDADATYRLQLEDFLAAAAAGRQPRVSGHDGLRVLELLAEARSAD